MQLASHKNVIKWITEILGTGKSELGNAEPPKGADLINVHVACPVDVLLTNGTESLSSSTTTYNSSTSYGEFYPMGKSGEIKFFAVKKDNYVVQLQGTDTGTMDYSLRYFDTDNAVIETRDLYDVPVTKDTHIITDTNMDNPTVLVDKKKTVGKT